MDDGSRLPWIAAVLLLFCAAFFAVTETAIASCSKTKIKTADDHGDRRAKEALFVLDNFDMAITTLLICTNIVHISVASIVTVAVTRKWGLNAVSVSTIITTIVVFFAGEMLPKSIAKKYSEKLTLLTTPALCFFMKVFKPLAWLLTKIGQSVAALTKGDPEISVTEDEIYDIIEDMTEVGTLNEEQGDLISSALQFGDLTAESILTPRVDLEAIDIDDDLSEILEQIKVQNHSRLPVYKDSIDNVIGVLQIRKFIKAYLHNRENTDIRPLLDQTMFVHQSTKIDELLNRLSREKLNMAVITDNYGGTVGIVTVEDILEELVGEIWDEDDIVKEPIVQVSDSMCIVDADVQVTDALETLGYEDPEEDEELESMLAGEWAYNRFSTIPVAGDSFDYHRIRVTVAEMEHNRILKLYIALLPKEEEGEQAE